MGFGDNRLSQAKRRECSGECSRLSLKMKEQNICDSCGVGADSLMKGKAYLRSTKSMWWIVEGIRSFLLDIRGRPDPYIVSSLWIYQVITKKR